MNIEHFTDPRSTRYIYNLQITAPPNNMVAGRHIVVGSDSKNNIKIGYDINNSWIKSNGPMNVDTNGGDINITPNMNLSVQNKTFNLVNTDKFNFTDTTNNGFVWQGNNFNTTKGLNINANGQINLNNNTNIIGGKSQFNPNNTFTQFANNDGKNIIAGDTNIFGNLNTDGPITSNNNLTVNANSIFKGGLMNGIGVGNTHFPYTDNKNYIRGDTQFDSNININGSLNLKGNSNIIGNITSNSLNVAGPAIATSLQVDGPSTLRAINSNDHIYIKGGKSEFNLNNYNSHFPYDGDNKNYIRGDTQIDGNINTAGDITLGRNLKVNGNITYTGQLLNGASPLLPTGLICMWSGSIYNIPVGWKLCDGQNGTPDLRSRFIIGASKPEYRPSGNYYDIGNIGGTSSVMLSTGNLPPHSHSLSFDRPTLSHNCWRNGECGGPRLVDGGTWSGQTSVEGGGAPFSIMPPYYALAFIIKS